MEEKKDEEKQQNGRSEALQKRAQWLRAAILGANDGLLSTTSLMLGVGAARDDRQSMVLSGLAGALAGALSMAVGEFVSVSTQRDIEREANLKLCVSKPDPLPDNKQPQQEVKIAINNPTSSPLHPPPSSHSHKDDKDQTLTTTALRSPGRSPILRVLSEDARRSPSSPRRVLGDVLEDERAGADARHLPNPYKASAASALAFLCGSLVPLASAAFVARDGVRIVVVAVVASIALVVFGGAGAYLGKSPVRVSALRVLVGGWVAMGVTYGLLKPFDRDHSERST